MRPFQSSEGVVEVALIKVILGNFHFCVKCSQPFF